MAWVGSSRARAKINLTLHITQRREDGYHTLESLVAFAGFGDELELIEGKSLSLTITGPEASHLGDASDNHIIKAVTKLIELKPSLKRGAFRLIKRLPIASGMGGGSADAAAALRLIARLNHLSPDDPVLYQAALQTGADVPVCLASKARMMRGIGEELGAPLILPRLFAVLVNPRQGSSTPAVFKEIGLKPGEKPSNETHPTIVSDLTRPALLQCLGQGRNDMQTAATALLPVIGEVQAALTALPDCRFARMSGSGATVFGVFDTCRAAAKAAKLLKRTHPDWWVKATVIG
jgi:4-diphosphocytidyl-2-C-methyl-D-erythritol kinase